MAEQPRADELKPTGKDPVEGAPARPDGAPPLEHPEESHLGDAGDPVEGPRD